MRTLTTFGLDAHAAFGPLAAIPIFLSSALATVGSAAGSVAGAVGGALSGVGAGAGAVGTAASAASGAGGILSGLSAGAGLLGSATSLVSALNRPKLPNTPPPPPQPTMFGGNLRGGANASLAASNPLAASSFTNTGVGAAPSGGGAKTLLGN